MNKYWTESIFNSPKDKSSLYNFLICLVLIVLFFHVRYGLGIINPTETAWMMKYDWAQHYMGWYFYRNDPWTFPIGNIQSLFFPIGTNVGFTDSIPLVAILIKPFSILLPEQFQYFGFWLFLGHILVAFFSIKLLNIMKVRGIVQLIAVVLITFNPMLMYRAMHVALSAHWLIVANLWIYFLDPQVISKNKILLYQLTLLIAGGLINPYFALINGGFLFILSIKLWLYDQFIDLKIVVPYVVGSLIALISSWLLTGYFALSSSSQLGVSNAYGKPSWNLSSFFNPYTFDRFHDFYTNNLSSYLPAAPLAQWEQYESFSYFGLGLLVLSVIVIGIIIGHSRIRKDILNLYKRIDIIMLSALTLLLALFAISNIVTFNERVIFSFPLPSSLRLFSDIFRASARFIWVAYYLWIFFLIYVLSKTGRKEYVIAAVSIIMIIQFADIRQMIFNKKLEYGPYKTKLSEPHWENLIRSTDEVLFLPPLQSSYLTPDDWQYFSFLSVKNRKPVSAGHIARIDFDASQKYARKMLDQILERKLDSTAIYIMLPGYYSQFITNYFSRKIDLVMLDGYLVICPFNNKYKDLPTVLEDIKKNVNQDFIKDHFQIHNPIAFSDVVPVDNPAIKSGIYEVSECKGALSIRGWCFTDKSQDEPGAYVRILIKDFSGKTFYIPTIRFGTRDVAEFFKNDKLSMAGFAGVINTSNLPNGGYQLGLEVICTTGENCESERKWIDSYVKINNPTAPSNIQWNIGSDKINSDINVLKADDQGVTVEGWAFQEGATSSPEIYLTVSNDVEKFAFRTSIIGRPDVAKFYNNPALENSGFMIKFDASRFGKGPYNLGFLLYDTQRKKYFHNLSERKLDLSVKDSVKNQPPPGELVANFLKPKTLSKLPPKAENVKAYLDHITEQKYFYTVEGWGFVSDMDDRDSRVYLVLTSGEKIFKISTKKHFRPDLRAAFKHTFSTDSSGFDVGLRKEDFPGGKYKLGILIENKSASFYMPLENPIEF